MKNKRILLVGGAGYIGSHMVYLLKQIGAQVAVFDSLVTGHRDAVGDTDFVLGDIRRKSDIEALFEEYRCFDAVLHFAAFCYVGESMVQPGKYYENNVGGTITLVNAMHKAGIDKMVFSSSCATYGLPQSIPITEVHPQLPVNPYGKSKLMIEQVLQDYGEIHNLNSISLRYFNAAGCHCDGILGERHDPETHLIPLVLLEAKRILDGGKLGDTRLQVFGDDWETDDGTCVRDYIHVEDLCRAHLMALERLFEDRVNGAEHYNLGNGMGYSVLEIIKACRKVTGVDIQFRIKPRRPGDPPKLVGSYEKASEVLGWQPEICRLEDIIRTAWNWFNQ